MSGAMQEKVIRTQALVLKRVNYGESDRILDLLTPLGRFAVVAKGVRKERSKLAGGIELFCLSDVVIRLGREGGLGILSSVKMKRFFANILQDLKSMELGLLAAKKVNYAVEDLEAEEFFDVLLQVWQALDDGRDLRVIEAWFVVNFLRLSGEEVNLSFDIDGERLRLECKYRWDVMEKALCIDSRGEICADVIKILRLMSCLRLEKIFVIKDLEKYASILKKTVNYNMVLQ